MVRRNLTQIADERVALATGHGRQHWFTLLDVVGAPAWKKGRIAAFLADEGLTGWWSDALAVEYHDAADRHLSQLGDAPHAFAGVTLASDVDDVWDHLADDAERAAWLGQEWPAEAPDARTLRLKLPDDSEASLEVVGPAQLSDGHESMSAVRVRVEHIGLADQKTAERMEEFWNGALERLAGAVVGF